MFQSLIASVEESWKNDMMVVKNINIAQEH